MDEIPKSNDGDVRLGMQRCPICGKATVVASRPFCSPRCREIDLGRWLAGSYVIAGGGTDEDGEESRSDDPVGHDRSSKDN